MTKAMRSAHGKKSVARMFVLVLWNKDFDCTELKPCESKDKALDEILSGDYLKSKGDKRVLRAFEVTDSGIVTKYELEFKSGELRFVADDTPDKAVESEDDGEW